LQQQIIFVATFKIKTTGIAVDDRENTGTIEMGKHKRLGSTMLYGASILFKEG